MSYEGYDQVLCKNGHLYEFDAHGCPICDSAWLDDAEPWKCPICGETHAWHHCVDLTNGSDPNTGEGMPYPLKEAEPAKYETCDKCGGCKLIAPPRYEIPERK